MKVTKATKVPLNSETKTRHGTKARHRSEPRSERTEAPPVTEAKDNYRQRGRRQIHSVLEGPRVFRQRRNRRSRVNELKKV